MAAWALVGSWAYSTNVANVDFTGLGSYTDVRIFMRSVTTSANGLRILRVSTDNGSTFLSASGDYISVDTAGTETAGNAIGFHQTANTAARSGDIEINGFNLTSIKTAQRINRTDARTTFIPTTSALSAVRVLESSGANLTGGNIFVYAR